MSEKKEQLTGDLADLLDFALKEKCVTISMVQRDLGWGWPRTVKTIDKLIKLGYMKKDGNNPSRFVPTISEEEAELLKKCD